MIKQLILLIAALACFTTTAATAASSDDLNGSAVRKALTGKDRISERQRYCSAYQVLSQRDDERTPEHFPAGLVGGAPTQDTGRWWIARDQLCQRWNRWQSGKSYCYKLSRQGQSLVWVRDDGRRGTARIGS